MGYVSFHSSLNTTAEALGLCRRGKNTNTHLARPVHTVDAAAKSGPVGGKVPHGEAAMGRPCCKENPVSTLDHCLPEGKHGKTHALGSKSNSIALVRRFNPGHLPPVSGGKQS